MLKTIPIALFTLLAAFAAPGYAAKAACPPAAEKPSQEQLKAASHNASDHGYLWRISKDGRTSYLYGTIHVGKLGWVFPGPKVTEAMRATDSIALEFDMLDPAMQQSMKKAMAEMHSNPVSAPLEKRLRHMADTLCVPYEQLAKAPPEMQVAVLSMLSSRWEGLDASYAVDSVLAALGHRDQKNMVSLETPESQLQSLLMKTPEETAEFVKSSLDELESNSAHKVLKRLAEAWANSNFDDLEHYQDWCDCLKTDIERLIMKRLLDERNPAMAEHIDALHKSGKQVFAAVGSMHMFGPVGLPALMEKRGYKVERVDFKAAQATTNK